VHDAAVEVLHRGLWKANGDEETEMQKHQRNRSVLMKSKGKGKKGRRSTAVLTQDDIEFLKKNTRYDEAEIKEWYKGFKQDCPDGHLTREAFMKIYSKCFTGGSAQDFCDHVFRTFDSDKNGFIDFKEFLLAIDVTSSGTPEQKLNWAFRMYDVDENGMIDLNEMTKLVRSIFKVSNQSQRTNESADSRAVNIFKKMDVNSDGIVTREEFVNACLADNSLMQMLTPQTGACHLQ